MIPETAGYFAAGAADIPAGQRYGFRLDGGALRPDPASRWQPEGVHQPSAVWDASFAWTDGSWSGVPRNDLVIYELHVGTFTPEGTFAAVIPRLGQLKELGVTAIELMPLAQFPGTRNWGYDGVYWFAVQNAYGGPTELQRLIDACHSAGLAVILDVVYNHVGPEGNYLGEFGHYFSDVHHTPWGRGINFDGHGSEGVRRMVASNVRQWIADFHLDGLRLDAVHAIFDTSARHILSEIKAAADDEASRQNRRVHVIAESDANDVRLLDPPAQGGYGLDAQWSDDFHHSVHVLLTGEQHAYYADFADPATKLIKALNDTFVYDGCYSPHRRRLHGAPAREHGGDRFIVNVQTHDQVGNRARGERLAELVPPEKQRLAAGLLLLAPHLPLLFMGEEYGETRPFPFFCSFGDESVVQGVREGRQSEFAAHRWTGGIPDPQDEQTFLSAKLTWGWPEGSHQAGLRRLYADLLAARKKWPALSDYRHRRAELRDAAGATLLVLERGNPELPAEQIIACFNLGPSAASINELRENRGVLLRSQCARYAGGGGVRADAVDSQALAPYEFAVFGRQGAAG